MNRINSVYQSPTYANNYQNSVTHYAPAFKQNAKIAQAAVDTVSDNRKNVFKYFAALLGSLGILDIAKRINQTEEANIATDYNKTQAEKFLESFELLKGNRWNRTQKIDAKLDNFIKETIKTIPKEAEKRTNKVMNHAKELMDTSAKSDNKTIEYFNIKDRKKHIVQADIKHSKILGKDFLYLVSDRPVDSISMWQPATRIHFNCPQSELDKKPTKVFYLTEDGNVVNIEYNNQGKPSVIGREITRNGNSVEVISIYLDSETQTPKYVKLVKNGKSLVLDFDEYKKNEINHIDLGSVNEPEVLEYYRAMNRDRQEPRVLEKSGMILKDVDIARRILLSIPGPF